MTDENKVQSKGLTYCRPSMRNKHTSRTSESYCKCGYKKRGVNHPSGVHHRMGKKK
jgi:hypothetical protein